MNRGGGWLIALWLAALPAAAQESPSYRLTEHVLNSGGSPLDGSVPTSAHHRVTLEAIGESVLGTGGASASFRLDGGFVSAYPPPREVLGVRFLDASTLAWDAEPSVGSYDLYRDPLSALPGLGYGGCAQSAIPETSTADPDVPAAGAGFFYLVTAENRLGEEGTKGTDGSGAERGNAFPCP